MAENEAQAPASPPADELLGTGQITVDTDESDSAYAESTHESDTTSLKSDVMKYKWEHGRRYHAYKDGAYWGPNDEKQLDAEDFVHQLLNNILNGRLFLAPLPKDPDVKEILDLGCGTGIWAIDMAEQFPAAQVTGIDLSPIQPSFVPPNCKFVVDDLNLDWVYPENHFDFIHLRMMLGSVPDWTEFYKKAFRYLKPGGWIEAHELSPHFRSDDGTLPKDGMMQKWGHLFDEAATKIGKPFDIATTQKSTIEQAGGYTNVTEHKIKIPCGTWPKDKNLKKWGIWYRVFLIDGLEGFGLRTFTAILGWSYEEAQAALAVMRQELRDPKVHGYSLMSVVYAQKPKTAT